MFSCITKNILKYKWIFFFLLSQVCDSEEMNDDLYILVPVTWFKLLLLSHFSCVQLYATPWTIDHQSPLFMEFSKQEYQSGWPCPPTGDLSNPGIEPGSPALQADSLPLSHQGSRQSFILHCFCTIGANASTEKKAIDFGFILTPLAPWKHFR